MSDVTYFFVTQESADGSVVVERRWAEMEEYGSVVNLRLPDNPSIEERSMETLWRLLLGCMSHKPLKGWPAFKTKCLVLWKTRTWPKQVYQIPKSEVGL